MAMTYQQQYVLDGAAGRDAILNLTARHNRCYSDGDRNGWIATFRHSGARFTRDGTEFTDLRAAFDGGKGRLVSVDHEISVDGVNATQRCVALLYAVTVGIASVMACGQIQDGIAPRRAVEYVLLLVGHGHLFSPSLTG